MIKPLTDEQMKLLRRKPGLVGVLAEAEIRKLRKEVCRWENDLVRLNNKCVKIRRKLEAENRKLRDYVRHDASGALKESAEAAGKPETTAYPSVLLERLLARWYRHDPCEAAKVCDEELDRSGALLGRVRDIAAADSLPLHASRIPSDEP